MIKLLDGALFLLSILGWIVLVPSAHKNPMQRYRVRTR